MEEGLGSQVQQVQHACANLFTGSLAVRAGLNRFVATLGGPVCGNETCRTSCNRFLETFGQKRLQQVPGNLLTSALGKTSFKPVDQADRQLAIVACTVRVDLDQVEVGRSGDEPRPPPLATRGRGD